MPHQESRSSKADIFTKWKRGNKMSKNKRYELSQISRMGYGVGELGTSIISFTVGSFLTMYLVDNEIATAAFIGTMMLVSRVLDGISDLVMGTIIDHTYTKWGKARPWILIGSIPTALSLVMMFNVPLGWPELAKNIYITVAYILSTVVFGTAASVSRQVLVTKSTRNPVTRASMMNWRAFFATAAQLLVSGFTASFVAALGGGTKGYNLMSILYAVLAGVAMMCTFFAVKELDIRPKPASADIQTRKTSNLNATNLKYLFCNKYVIPLIFGFILNWLGLGVNSNAAAYYARDVLGSISLMRMITWSRIIPALIVMLTGFIPIYVMKFGKQKTLMTGSVLAIAGCVIIWLNPVNIPAIFAGNILKGASLGFLNGTLLSTAADVAEYIDYKNNINIAGMTNSVASFGQKLGQGFASSFVAWGLAIGGWDAAKLAAGVAQSESAIQAIEVCFNLIPLACFALIFVIGIFMDVDKKMAMLRKERGETA